MNGQLSARSGITESEDWRVAAGPLKVVTWLTLTKRTQSAAAIT